MSSREIESIILASLILFLPLETSFSTSENRVCLYFFYGAGCLDCARVELQLSQLQQKYPQLDVHSFEIYGNRTNLQLLNLLFDKHGVPQEQRKIPAVFISDSYLTGEKQIQENLEETIIPLLERGCPCPSLEGEAKELTPISLLMVTGAALADSLNPCAMAILIFLLGLFSASDDRGRLLGSSVAFMVSIYLSYFLLGIGLLSTLQITGLSYWLYRAAGVFALVIGLLNIKDYFWPGSRASSWRFPTP